MNKNQPTRPDGTRDFSPEVMAKRNYILQTIRAVYQRYGFLPLETPAMENLDVVVQYILDISFERLLNDLFD